MNETKKKDLMKQDVIQGRMGLMKSMLESIPGEWTAREGLAETPLRVAAMWDELFAGYKQDGEQVLKDALFTDEHSEDLVLLQDIQFTSMCEHHVMPFFGKVHIAYIPQDGTIVGISKLARLVEIYARRLQVQERLGKQIAEAIKAVMNPAAIAVIVEAEHTCMTARGIKKPGAITKTAHLEGLFKLDEKARNELYFLLGGNR